jgi:hypothetical protein
MGCSARLFGGLRLLAAQALHPLLLLFARRGVGTDGLGRRQFLPFSDRLLPERPQLHRARTEPARYRLPQNDNAFLAVADSQAFEAAADRLTSHKISKTFACKT